MKTPKYPTLWSFHLNDTTGVLDNPEGPWGTTKHSFKQSMSGVLMIPQWFANTYLGGKTLALGMGGGYSTLTNGPAGMGPTLTAIPKPEGLPAMTHLSDTPLVGYPFSQNASWGTPDRSRRDTNYDVTPNQIPSSLSPNGGWLDGGKWDVQNGLGAWTLNDMIGANGIWIDTPNKHGVLFSAALTVGDIFYYSSDVRYEDVAHAWYMYDPMDLVSVANGSKSEWQIQAAWRTSVQYPFVSYPLNYKKSQINHADPADPDWMSGLPFGRNMGGMTFDPAENRLYIQKPHSSYGNVTPYSDDPVFLVYQLNGGGSSTPIPSPTLTPTLTPTATPSPTPVQLPIGQWKLDQSSGTTATDSSGNENHGTLMNGPVWTTGKVGNALFFDGVNDYVNLGNPSNLIPGGAITMSAWVNLKSTSATRMILSKDNGAANPTAIRIQAGGTVRCFMGGTASGDVGSISANTWNHIACTYDGSKIQVYINGMPAGSPVSKTGSIVDNPDGWIIGARSSGTIMLMNGLVDDVRIY